MPKKSQSLLSASEQVEPAYDYVPITASEHGNNLITETGFLPRGLVATADGDLVCRFLKSDADRTIPMVKGQYLVGYITVIKTGTACDPFVYY